MAVVIMATLESKLPSYSVDNWQSVRITEAIVEAVAEPVMLSALN